MINLKLVQVRGNLFGQAIVDNYAKAPHDVLDMIKAQYKDNPAAVKETLGAYNTNMLGLLNPLARFERYFPFKFASTTERHLCYKFSSLKELVENLKRSRELFSDLGLNLTAQGYAHRNEFRLYVIK